MTVNKLHVMKELRMNPDMNLTQAMVIFTSFRGQKLGFRLEAAWFRFFFLGKMDAS